jgi:hypothetical protein
MLFLILLIANIVGGSPEIVGGSPEIVGGSPE